MRWIRRALALLAGLLVTGLATECATSFASAQQPTGEADAGAGDHSRVIGQAVERQLLLEVETRLKSRDPATIAWGGWLAARHRVAAAVPAVRRALAELPEGEHRGFVAQSLLDALQVHGAKVARADLQGCERGLHEGLAFVLLARQPARNRQFFLDQYAQHDEQGRASRWLAAGNLLASTKDKAFARRLLLSLRYRLEVSVYCDGDSRRFGMSGAVGGRFGDGRITVPAGFPPLVTYGLQLSKAARAGDVLLAPGKQPVFYRREIHRGRKVPHGFGERIRSRRRQQQRVAWLAEMLERSAPELPTTVHASVLWQDAGDLRQRVAAARQKIAAKHQRLVAALIQAGLCSKKDQALFAAEIDVQIKDQRSDKSEPLTAVR